MRNARRCEVSSSDAKRPMLPPTVTAISDSGLPLDAEWSEGCEAPATNAGVNQTLSRVPTDNGHRSWHLAFYTSSKSARFVSARPRRLSLLSSTRP